ncbi:MAG: flagellar assembly protein FliW [Nocardioides sp.]
MTTMADPTTLTPETGATTAVTTQQAMDNTTELPVLEMVHPFVGFPDHHRFALARLDDDGTVCDLRSVDDPTVSFVVVPPHLFFPDYGPEVNDATVSELGVEHEDDLLTLVVVTLGSSAQDATANLLAPLLVNHRTRRAAQVVLDDMDLPIKAHLTAG